MHEQRLELVLGAAELFLRNIHRSAQHGAQHSTERNVTLQQDEQKIGLALACRGWSAKRVLPGCSALSRLLSRLV